MARNEKGARICKRIKIREFDPKNYNEKSGSGRKKGIPIVKYQPSLEQRNVRKIDLLR